MASRSRPNNATQRPLSAQRPQSPAVQTAAQTRDSSRGPPPLALAQQSQPAPAGAQKRATSQPPTKKPPVEAVANLNTVPEAATKGAVLASVKAHNEKRALHGCPPLGFSDVLSVSAKKWAESLIERNAFEHSPDQKYGENIYMRAGSQPISDDQAAKNSVEQWYDEIKHYKLFGKQPTIQELTTGSATGHFTQLIWKETQVMGFGLAKSPRDNKVIVVCNYAPAGNVVGVFQENVPALIGKAQK